MGVAGVEARPNAIAFEAGENPEEVGGLSEYQVREFVFQHALDTDFAAMRGHALEHAADMLDAEQAFFA